jgi:dTDP-4-dehydrorhamnose reductase
VKTVLIGADGQLGTDIVKEYPRETLIPLTLEDLDVRDYEEVRRQFREYAPEVVINTSAYHRVDECEDYPDRALEVNALAVRNLALVCRDIDAILVHFSTDYVFDGEGDRPYTEADMPRPVSAYAISKLAGELFVRYLHDKHFILRLCGLYGVVGSLEKGTNFVETMLRLAREGKDISVVSDQTLTPTYTGVLAPRIKALIETKQYGLYHMTCEGECSWFEFAAAIFELSGLNATLSPTTSDVYKQPAKRPRYSVLENANLKKISSVPPMPHWRDALADYLEERKRYRGEQ